MNTVFVKTQVNVKTVLFLTIQSNRSQNIIDRTPSSTTTPGQIGPGSDVNKRVVRIPQSSRITVVWPSVCLVSYKDTR